MGDILMKIVLFTLFVTFISRVSFGTPLWIDVPDNTVHLPGTVNNRADKLTRLAHEAPSQFHV